MKLRMSCLSSWAAGMAGVRAPEPLTFNDTSVFNASSGRVTLPLQHDIDGDHDATAAQRLPTAGHIELLACGAAINRQYLI